MRSRQSRIGWARVKTSNSRGWGLPRKWPKIPHFNKKRAVLLIALIIVGIFVADQAAKYSTGTPLVKGLIPDPLKPLWSDCNKQSSNWNLLRLATWEASGGSCTTGSGSLGNVIRLNSNSTHSAIAIDSSPIDISQGSSKVLEFDMEFAWSATSGDFPEVSVFLTRNNTLTTQPVAGYQPYGSSDTQVAFLERIVSFPELNPNTLSVNVYNQRDPSQSIKAGDTGCPSSGTVFQCASGTSSWTVGVWQATVLLNFTGTTSTPSLSTVNLEKCPTVPCTNLFSVTQSNLPQLSLTGSYYLGLSMAAQAASHNSVVFYGSYTPPNPNPFDINNQNSMSWAIYTPNPSTAQQPPYIDTGGFFGPIIKALIAIGVFILQSIMVFLGYLANVIRIGLNALGGFAGWGNIGDSFINAVQGIVGTIVQVGAAISTFLSNLVARGLDVITIATTISGTFFTGLSKFLSEMSVISGGIVTIFSKFFLYGGAFYFLYDIILYFQLTGDAGFEGVGTWIGFNKWAAFSLFGLFTRILNVLIEAFDWLLSHIPTIAARMPENGFPGIPQLEAGQFPGLRIPTGHVTKLREGDPAAFFLWAVGGFLILPFYLGSAISPLAGLTAAVGCSPTTCFNNMLTKVGYPFAGLFIIIFVGVTITEILHGITDDGGQRIVVQNKLPSGLVRTIKEAKGQFSFRGGKEGKIAGITQPPRKHEISSQDKMIIAQAQARTAALKTEIKQMKAMKR